MPTFYCSECNKETFRIRAYPKPLVCGPDCWEVREIRLKHRPGPKKLIDLGIGCEYCDSPLRSTSRLTRYCDVRCTKQAQRARKYGLTPRQLHELRSQAESNGCYICGGGPANEQGFHIDHCHATGKVRGMLCGPCNMGLGSFRDKPDLLRKAAAYLEE